MSDWRAARHPWRGVLIASALCLMAIVALAGCAPGNDGSDEIAFMRGGALWTMQPGGQDLMQIAAPTVLGFAWSPDHHQFVVRLSATRSAVASTNPLVGGYPDVYAVLGIISIDGGNIMTITPNSAIPPRSDGWWDATGNRLVYREDVANTQLWILSLPDQPAGIARKSIAIGSVIPATSPDGGTIATILANGAVVVGTPQATPRALAQGALTAIVTPGGVWPARPLWQPRHDAILYPAPGPDAATTALWLVDQSGQRREIAAIPDLEAYCWSPDGTMLLARTTAGYQVFDLRGAPVVGWPDASVYSAAWWSPDGDAVMAQTPSALVLAQVGARRVTTLVTWTPPLAGPSALPSAAAAWHPLLGSPWSADGHRFALVAPAGGVWQGGARLASRATPGTGVYIVDVDALSHSPPGLADWGEHTGLSWSTPDPDTQMVTP